MRGANDPDGRTAAPGLLRFARNDGQGIGSLVSACRLRRPPPEPRLRGHDGPHSDADTKLHNDLLVVGPFSNDLQFGDIVGRVGFQLGDDRHAVDAVEVGVVETRL
jgi:hypothetical protein